MVLCVCVYVCDHQHQYYNHRQHYIHHLSTTIIIIISVIIIIIFPRIIITNIIIVFTIMYMMMVMMMIMTTCATLFVCLTSQRSTGFQLQLLLAVAKASKRTPIGTFMPSPTLVCSMYSATLPSNFCFFRNWLLRLTVRTLTLDHLLRHHSLKRLISDSASFECTSVAKSLKPFAWLHVDEERLSSSAAVCVDSQPSETTVEPDLICLPMTFFKLFLPRGFFDGAASGCGSISVLR